MNPACGPDSPAPLNASLPPFLPVAARPAPAESNTAEISTIAFLHLLPGRESNKQA